MPKGKKGRKKAKKAAGLGAEVLSALKIKARQPSRSFVSTAPRHAFVWGPRAAHARALPSPLLPMSPRV